MKPARKGKLSPLSRTVVCKGSAFEVVIHADGKGKWLLELMDDLKIGSIWIDPFDTEQAALEAALRRDRRGFRPSTCTSTSAISCRSA